MTSPYRIKKLEYNLTNHCNLKCAHCDHFSPFFTVLSGDFTNSISPERFGSDLSLLSKYVHSETFWVLGGEPLMEKRSVEFLQRLRNSGITDEIVLVTNGFLLPHQPDALYQSVDKLRVSFYPPRPLPETTITKIRERCDALGTKMVLDKQPGFIVSVLGQKNPNPSQVNLIFQTCDNAWTWHCHVIQDGYLYRCSRAAVLGHQLHKHGIVDRDFHEDDGLKLVDTPEFADRVRAYLNRSTPLKSCSYCLGSVGKLKEHRQLSKEEIEQSVWTRDTVANGIDPRRAFKKFTLWRLFGRH
ncbi:MAG: radical SAM protein [Candidatus Korobacteraceae bacterium]|jgi:hypothetical protein